MQAAQQGRPTHNRYTACPAIPSAHLSKEHVVGLPAAQLHHNAGGCHDGEDGQAAAHLCTQQAAKASQETSKFMHTV